MKFESTGFVVNSQTIQVIKPVQREGEKTVRLHVFEYMTKRLDEVLSFVEHGHVTENVKPPPATSVVPQSPPEPIRENELERVVKDTMEDVLPRLLRELRVSPELRPRHED